MEGIIDAITYFPIHYIYFKFCVQKYTFIYVVKIAITTDDLALCNSSLIIDLLTYLSTYQVF